ncbi:MAG: patatin-like phospholipase family protein [Deltaproteobacteria bacterium]|uniref:Patatin-like phospholipase family protein n=1 Tax=Candidatus Zymogenus saltonus TaxID=2844893 RepID=A0A9D8KBW2_9DELT|nr:patatin-like phospholipase family protein [Candidatus Zymogenus saltonus]
MISKRILNLSILLAFLIFLASTTGCSIFSNKFVVYSQPIPQPKAYNALDDGDYFLAVTVSGGGSRSAVWSAAVFRELFRQAKLPDGRSILDEIDYISSVSGGSVSSAYYCLNKPESDTTNIEEHAAFFDKFVKEMRRNIERDILFKPWLWHRIFLQSVERAYFLKWDFDKYYFHNATFNDLYKRQIEGICPTLIVNGTVMDTGSKFLFTTVRRDVFSSHAEEELGSKLIDTGMGKSNVPLEEGLLNIKLCEDIGISVGDMEVSRAVVASAAVPLIFGPIIFKDEITSTPENPKYVHVVDGGVGDTLGLESIMELVFDRYNSPGKKYRGGMVIIIDANQRIDPTASENLIRGLKAGATIERTRVIYAYRGKTLAYITIMFIQDNSRYKDIDFVYISPYLVKDPAILESLRDEQGFERYTPSELDVIVERFQKTPTRFQIKPELADNLECAARLVVGTVKDRILENYLRCNGVE